MKTIYIKLFGLCVAGTLFADPTYVFATETLNDVVTQTGISSLLQDSMTEAEYIKVAKQAEGTFWGYTNLGIANVDKNLNVRKEPNENSGLAGKMPKDSACEILGIEDQWAHIISGEVEGYVHTDFLFMDVEAKLKAAELVKPVAVVGVDALKVREHPNTECQVLTTVLKGEELEYIETLGEWVKVSMDNEEVYVFGEYVTIEEKLKTAVTMTELRYGEGVSDVRVDLCEYAKQFLGNPYVWGGTSLTKGADCSGFVLSVYKKFGYSLPHSSKAQAKQGTKISYSEIQPGDLIFYTKNGSINHVAIYIGGGQVIHASSPKTGIKISKYNYRKPYRYVRIIND